MEGDMFGQSFRLDEKIVIIINGKGGVGKDTVCDIAAKFFSVKSISAITPIKTIARSLGWNGEKDSKSRKFLSDLKRTLIEYNGLPNNYLEEEYIKFKKSEYDILFVHIRENDQIEDFKKRVDNRCVTLLVRSTKLGALNATYGNSSDDNVEDYAYDYYYMNDQTMEDLTNDFFNFIHDLFVLEGVLS